MTAIANKNTLTQAIKVLGLGDSQETHADLCVALDNGEKEKIRTIAERINAQSLSVLHRCDGHVAKKVKSASLLAEYVLNCLDNSSGRHEAELLQEAVRLLISVPDSQLIAAELPAARNDLAKLVQQETA